MTATQQDVEAISSLIEEASSASEDPQPVETKYPSDGHVTLTLGLWDPSNGVVDDAEVRELNGYDEEALAKAPTLGHGMQIALERAVETIGGKPCTKAMLDELTIGDRMELLLGIRRVTWGEEIETYATCPKCGTEQEVTVTCEEIPRREVEDKVADRQFRLDLSKGEGRFHYPSGVVHKKMLTGKYSSNAEAATALIMDCAIELNGMPLLSEKTAKSMSLKDRNKITEYVSENIPGPLLEKIPCPCVSCGEEIMVSASAGTLFPW